MDRFEEMRIFVAVAQAQRFSSAARQLALSAPRVTRVVAALEARLGVVLLQRTTRHVQVTEAGRRFLDDALHLLGQLTEAEAVARGSYVTPQGLVHLTAPVLFGEYFVTPLLVRYLADHPSVRVRADLVDRPVNLIEEGLDIAVRIAHVPPDCEHRTIPVGQVRPVVCASPSWLAEHGEPLHPAELEALPAVVVEGGLLGGQWRFEHATEVIDVTPQPRLRISTSHAALTAVEVGAGITRLLSYQAAPSEAAGKVRRVLRAYEPPPVPINIWITSGRERVASVRTLAEFLAAQLRADPALGYAP